jgi:Tol biopolymer transport system component
VADSKLPLNELTLDLDDFLDRQSEIGKRDQVPRPEGITTTQILKRTSNSPMGIVENSLTDFARRVWVHSWLAAVIVAGLLLFAVVRWGLVRRVGIGSSQTLEVINLTNDGRVLDAAISPDGKLLASTRITSGRQSLWVRDLTSDQEWQLLPPALTRYWGMRFTPNGNQILYVSTQPTDSATVLSRIPVHGGSPTRIAAGIEGPPTISPDGMHVAFVRTYPVQHRDALIVTTPDGGGERELAVRNHPDKFSSSGPAWSPDGKSIAIGIGRNSDAECAIASISVDGATVVERTGWQWAAIGGMAWHNSGRTLVFSARPLHKTSLQLWSLNISDLGLKQITDEDREYEEVTLSQTSSTLVTINTYEVSDVWAVSQSGDVRRLTTGGHEGADGLTTSSNAQIVFTEGEYDQSKLWGMNVDGTNRHRLTDNTGFLPFAARGGTLVAYVSTTGGTHHIWLIESDGRNNRQLTFGGGENYPTLTPDNNWVIYTSLAQGRGTLWRIPTSGGDPVQLTYEGIFVRPVVSPDGKTIACSWRRDESDKWQTAILPLDGGPPLKTFELPLAYLQIIRWTPNSRSFVYVNKKNGVQNLWEQPVDGSSPRQITNFSEDLILHYDLAASGEFILSRGGRRRDIAMIKNFD